MKYLSLLSIVMFITSVIV